MSQTFCPMHPKANPQPALGSWRVFTLAHIYKAALDYQQRTGTGIELRPLSSPDKTSVEAAHEKRQTTTKRNRVTYFVQFGAGVPAGSSPP